MEYVSTAELDHKRAPPPPPRDLAAPAPPPLRLASRPTARAPRHLACPKDAGTRSHPGARAAGRADPHLPPSRAPGRRADVLAILAFPARRRRSASVSWAWRATRSGTWRSTRSSSPRWARVRRVPGARLVLGARPRVETPLASWHLRDGLEGANLDHTARSPKRFRAIGDEAGAALQERIGAEEVPHVRFALHWFARWTAPMPPRSPAGRRAAAPLSPLLMRGAPLHRAARLEAGFSPAFVDELERWSPS